VGSIRVPCFPPPPPIHTYAHTVCAPPYRTISVVELHWDSLLDVVMYRMHVLQEKLRCVSLIPTRDANLADEFIT
jgi:hypothetical protein